MPKQHLAQRKGLPFAPGVPCEVEHPYHGAGGTRSSTVLGSRPARGWEGHPGVRGRPGVRNPIPVQLPVATPMSCSPEPPARAAGALQLNHDTLLQQNLLNPGVPGWMGPPGCCWGSHPGHRALAGRSMVAVWRMQRGTRGAGSQEGSPGSQFAQGSQAGSPRERG